MMRSACLAVVLLSAAAPVLCLRPFEQISSFVSGLRTHRDEPLPATADKPWFCHDLECPEFKVVNNSKGYETRQYKAAKWVSTQVSGLLYEPAVATGFKRLFDYISGENADATKIPMTAPVLTVIEPGQGPLCKSNFTVHFYVPSEFQESTPKPKNELVTVFSAPAGTAYVSQFGGFLVDDVTLSLKAKALRADLIANNERFLDGKYLTASYDPPFRVQHRHNEIMYIQTDPTAQ